MKKHLLSFLLALMFTGATWADDTQTVTIDGTAAGKTVKQITFNGNKSSSISLTTPPTRVKTSRWWSSHSTMLQASQRQARRLTLKPHGTTSRAVASQVLPPKTAPTSRNPQLKRLKLRSNYEEDTLTPCRPIDFTRCISTGRMGFSEISSIDLSDLNNDADNWYYDSEKDRYSFQKALTEQELTANGSTFAFTPRTFLHGSCHCGRQDKGRWRSTS